MQFWLQITSADNNRAELDSHVDTCVAETNMIILKGLGKVATVSSFSPELDSFNQVPIGTCITTYNESDTGKPVILILNETLFLETARWLAYPTQTISKRQVMW